jgi:hypothetical protein
VGIGFNFIGRKVGEEIKKFIQLIFEARKGDNRNSLLYNSAGEDSVPLNDERIILLKVDGAGKYVAVGVLTPSQGAKPGEKIFFGRDQKGVITIKIKMLNKGDYIFDNYSETTGEATGNYSKKIKGSESKEVFKNNDAIVHENRTVGIEGDDGLEVMGNKTKNVGGDESWAVGGNLDIGVGGALNINAAGPVVINGATINLN